MIMHDPMTVAFKICYPWKSKSKIFPQGRRCEFITIWHCDPGGDSNCDSCGWTSPRLTEAEKKLAMSYFKTEDLDK